MSGPTLTTPLLYVIRPSRSAFWASSRASRGHRDAVEQDGGSIGSRWRWLTMTARQRVKGGSGVVDEEEGLILCPFVAAIVTAFDWRH